MPSLSTKIRKISILAKNNEKQRLNFSRSAAFYMETRVRLKHFVNDCLPKHFLVSNLPQVPSNLISLIYFVN